MKKSTLAITCALVAIMIDMMGMGLVFPLLPDLFLSANSPLISAGTSGPLRAFHYGLALALWAGGIFFGAPFLGELSDRYGRKRILTLALSLVGLTYFSSCFSLFSGSLFLFMLSRLINGFFSSSFPLAQAIIIDVSTDENRTRHLSWIILAASIGFLVGPLLAALSYHLAATGTHGAAWSFLSAGLLSTLNAVGIHFLLNDEGQVFSHRRINLLSVVTTCRFVFMDQRIRAITLVFFLMQVSWGIYIQSIPVILSQGFLQSAEAVSLFYALLGGCFLAMTLWIQPPLLKRFKLEKLCFIALLIMFVSVSGALVAYYIKNIHLEWLFALPFAMSECLCYTAMTALYSNAVHADEQGRVMGGAGAIFGLTWALLGLGLGSVLSASLLWPFLMAAFCAALGAFFLFVFKSKK